MGGQFLLYVQVPLLDVRPDSLVRDGNDGKRKEVYQSSPSADILVSGDVRLRRRKHEWRGALQRFAVAFVAVGVLVEGSEQAHAQAKIKSETLGEAPIVLKVRLDDPVAVVILVFPAPLLVARDISQEQIGEGIAGGD